MKIWCVLNEAAAGIATAEEPALVAWSRALGAECLTFSELEVRLRPGATPDVVFAEVEPGSCAALAAIGERLRSDPRCTLVMHVSRALPLAVEARRELGRALASAALVLTPHPSVAAELRQSFGLTAFTVARPFALASLARIEEAARKRPNFCVIAPAGYDRRAFLRDVGMAAYLAILVRFRLCFLAPDATIERRAEALRGSRLAYLAVALTDAGALAALCAQLGVALLAPFSYEPARTLFPYTCFPEGAERANKRRRSLLLLWVITARGFAAFFRDTAHKRLALFRDENCRVQFFRALGYIAPNHEYFPLAAGEPSLFDQIRPRSRRTETVTGPCVVVCLVRNGREHLPSFLAHYRALGVREFVFVDNGSDDGTLECLAREPDVSLYETRLAHKDYETQIRRLAIEAHCRRRWCLNVDIDELFDYPCSAELGLGELVRYLELRGATAMVAHMLDMFDRDNRRLAGELDLRTAYPDYDITALERSPYDRAEARAFCDGNTLQAPIPCLSGGVRQTVFGSKSGARYLLIKHPLLFLDGVLEPVTHPHYSNHATVADVTGVLYHYKFTPSLKAKALESRATGRYVKFAQEQYEQYLGKLGSRDSIAIATKGTRRLAHVDELAELGFLHVSPAYRQFVAQHAPGR